MKDIRIFYDPLSLEEKYTTISVKLYPNIVTGLFSYFSVDCLNFYHYLTFMTKCWTNIYIVPEHYSDGTNYNWQLLGYKTSGLYGDNNEYPTYALAMKYAIEYSLPIIEGVLEEMNKDTLHHFETTLHIATPEQQTERRSMGERFLEASRKRVEARRNKNV